MGKMKTLYQMLEEYNNGWPIEEIIESMKQSTKDKKEPNDLEADSQEYLDWTKGD